ncbi:MAG: single-stranded-DNA-specific exonuclease RecJ [Planctomycetaceae bacterium]|jgi:single-stranded-DNA-specific exonuclease|nr:single-stranded-DNA-specific exonuclease RecJ [Planctomycetaceae bacterium]
MAKRWIICKYDNELARSISISAQISDLTAVLLAARGIQTCDAARAFLNANLKDHLREPFLLPGCREVAEHLLDAVNRKQKIVVYGDYDVDGITGIVILRQTLKDLGADVDYYVPSRLDEGYGLHSEAVIKLAQNGINVIVTVDCGISSVEEAKTAAEYGIKLLITDHHTPGTELPNAAAIAHPQLVRLAGKCVSVQSLTPEEIETAEKYPFPLLCGSAVALKVAWALGQLAFNGPGKPVSPQFRERLTEMLGLAALGTVADFVPLQDENRALVRGGLQYLHSPKSSAGLKQLFAVSKYVEGKTRVDSEYAAFQLAPRLNAAGRLGQAGLAVELLIGNDLTRVTEIAKEIDELNESRKMLEKRIAKEAEQQIHDQFDSVHDSAFVLSGDWHRGVIGIVAGRLVEQFHRPVILLGKDKMGNIPAVGSARSTSGFNLYTALEACRQFLIRFGGHEAAAGLTIDEKEIDSFRAAFCDIVAKRITEEERIAELLIDGVFPLGAFTRSTVEQILSLAPFGSANPRPVFAAEKVLVQNAKTMGKDNNHFAAEFHQHGIALRGIAFNRKNWFDEMQPYHEPIDIAFKVRISDFNHQIELDILDWKRATS